MLSPWSLRVVFFSILGQSAAQSQYPLGFNHIKSENVADIDSNPIPPVPYSWYGLTTFAQSNPLRCLSVDENQRYDVAILGMFNGTRRTLVDELVH